MFRDFLLIIAVSIFTSFAFCQTLKYSEIKTKATDMPYNGPYDNALLIFQTDLDLTFEASNDPLKSIIKEDGKYKVLISTETSQLVAIISKCCGRIMFNFVYNELGVLNPKEIRYFLIEKANIIGGIVDITNEEKAKGTSDFPGYNEKDGYLFFYNSAIPNFELKFIEKNGYVTKVVREIDRYRLYAKTGVPFELKIITEGYDDIVYPIDTLCVKGVKYFRFYPFNNVEKIKTNKGGETVTDIDGNIYQTVKIGTQVWIVENLKTTKYKNGKTIPLVTDNHTWSNLTSPGYCWYDNNIITYKDNYGALYNWYAVNTGKLCPSGWHVPTDDEWETLMTYMGGESVAGKNLKETGTTHWLGHNTEANNESGFTALPGGWRDSVDPFCGATFREIGSCGYWWSSTKYSTVIAFSRNMRYNYNDAFKSDGSKVSGFSVRCLRN